MPTTYVKALVNMYTQDVTLTNEEDPFALPVVAQARSAATCYMPIPWCTTQTDFDNHKKLRLEFNFAEAVGAPHIVTNIYQQTTITGDMVRFTMDGDPLHPIAGIGFSTDFHPRGFDDSLFGARPLASDRSGTPFIVSGDTDAIIVVDERLWVIVYRIGHQPRR